MCKKEKPTSEFYVGKSGIHKDKIPGICKKCETIKALEYRHRTGQTLPMNENKGCTAYLGIHVAERALSKFFNNITRMPNGNPGYDFICGKGFKIDVKSSCIIHRPDHSDSWALGIDKNEIPDYYLCLLFDNRANLEPQHVFLIPGEDINHLTCLRITNTYEGLLVYKKYEQPLDKVIECCNLIKTEA